MFISVFTKKRIRRMLVKLNKDSNRQRRFLRPSYTGTRKMLVKRVPLISFSVLHVFAFEAFQLRKAPRTGWRTDSEAGRPR